MTTFVADWFGARRIPCSLQDEALPTVRRSCQPIPGPTGLPVAVPDMVDARWLAIPTASTCRRPGTERSAGNVENRTSHHGGVELDKALGRRGRQHFTVLGVGD